MEIEHPLSLDEPAHLNGLIPASYFPLSKGVYDVKPGLVSFGTDLGNGAGDRHVFQIDQTYAQYRAGKLSAREERLDKYYVLQEYPPTTARTVAEFIAKRLAAEYPDLFTLSTVGASRLLHCRLSGERLTFDCQWQLAEAVPEPDQGPVYSSALDALCSQLQEDLAVICRRKSGTNWIAALHICFPNHWASQAKIGQDFAAVHEPVPGMERTNSKSRELVAAMIDRGPFVRFVWGLGTHNRLNNHPESSIDRHEDRAADRGGRFDANAPCLFLRVERQVIWGFPQTNAALFTIRTYLTNVQELRADRWRRDKIIAALRSMSDESLRYKGIADRDLILHWLQRKD